LGLNLTFGFGLISHKSTEMLLILAFGLYYHATISRPKSKAKAKSTYLGPVCLGYGWLAVQGKLLCRESCYFEFHCLTTWLAV
jgi:hypothetical protein